MIAFLLGILYICAGLRLLWLIDDLLDSYPIRWVSDAEWRMWLCILLWPLAVVIDLVLHGADRLLTRVLRKGVR